MAYRDYACMAGSTAAETEGRARALDSEYDKPAGVTAETVLSAGARTAIAPRVRELEAAERRLQCRIVSTQPHEYRNYRYPNTNVLGGDIYLACALLGTELETKARADRAIEILNAPTPTYDPLQPLSAQIQQNVAEQTKLLRERYACAQTFL